MHPLNPKNNLLLLRNKAWARARHTGDPSDWLAFRQLRSQRTSSIRKAKSTYYLDLIFNTKSDPSKFWK